MHITYSDSIDTVAFTVQETGGFHITSRDLKNMSLNGAVMVDIEDECMYGDLAIAYVVDNGNPAFVDALKSTATHRETTHIFTNISSRLDGISRSDTLRSRWNKYTKDYRYTDGIAYEDVMDAVRGLVQTL